MAKKLEESEGDFEKLIICDEKAEVKSPEEIEDGVHSTPLTWDPFTLFPREIYSKIFNFLKSPKDKENFMKAHIKWYELFKAERVQVLIGKVLDECGLEGDTVIGGGEGRGKRYQEFLLPLRLVCRCWDESVQNHYQLNKHHFRFKFCEDEWDTSKKLSATKDYGVNRSFFSALDEDGRLANCVEELTAPEASLDNPFLTRKMKIGVDSYRIRENVQLLPIWTQIDRLLENFGDQIWHLNFQTTWRNQQICVKMLDWLRLTEELKTLQIRFFVWQKDERVEGTILALKEWIRAPPPKIKKLQNLHLANFPAFVANKLLEGTKALEKLEVHFDVGNPSFAKLIGYQIPTNLKELALTLTGPKDFEYLKSFGEFPLLRKLIVNIKPYNDFKSWPEWEMVWKALEEKFPALEDLHLSLPKAYSGYRIKALEQSLSCRLNLKKLKRLSIILPNLSSLDFLQEMKGLRDLKITLDEITDKFEGLNDSLGRESLKFKRGDLGDVRFHVHRFDSGTMKGSNIWRVLPKLRKISFHVIGTDEVCLEETKAHSYQKRMGGEVIYSKTFPTDSQNYNGFPKGSFHLQF